MPICAPRRLPRLAGTFVTMSSTVPDLSIIIPSYNEESRLPATLERIAAYLLTYGREAEVLVVDDGSEDGTAAVAESFRSKIPRLRVVSNGVNRGKGYSVRYIERETAILGWSAPMGGRQLHRETTGH